jgi:hypothetical protein
MIDQIEILRGEAPKDLGYGFGSGNGSGNGYGDGYGDGSGYSNGNGYGYGYGFGSGYGSGYGYGDGSGYGDGNGYGSGSGSGYGYGDGYWLATIPSLASRWPLEQQERYAAVQRRGARIAFWCSRPDGRPANGGRGAARKAGDVEQIEGPLELCGPRALHATLRPDKWDGERVWVVALFGEVAEREDKLGALHREILGEAWTKGAPR